MCVVLPDPFHSLSDSSDTPQRTKVSLRIDDDHELKAHTVPAHGLMSRI